MAFHLTKSQTTFIFVILIIASIFLVVLTVLYYISLITLLCLLFVFAVAGAVTSFTFVTTRRKKRKDDEEGVKKDFQDQISEITMRFTYKQLETATKDFQKQIGNGAFGSVFKGKLANGEKIAVKRLHGFGSQEEKEFLTEVNIIGSTNHSNLVRLIGYCAENNHRLLVFEFMSNGSLDKWIFNTQWNQLPLSLQTRKSIILNVAKGLAYLHEECRKKIVHFDIKPQNILLDAKFHAKISDFGLSKLVDRRSQTRLETAWRGTPGYMAPEWLSSVVTEKADVYSFGVVVMEVICGRKNVDRSFEPEESKYNLLPTFMKKAKEDQLIEMIDPCCEILQSHSSEAEQVMKLAAWCLQNNFRSRPSMSTVVKVLQGSIDVPTDLEYSESEVSKTEDLNGQSRSSPSILSGST